MGDRKVRTRDGDVVDVGKAWYWRLEKKATMKRAWFPSCPTEEGKRKLGQPRYIEGRASEGARPRAQIPDTWRISRKRQPTLSRGVTAPRSSGLRDGRGVRVRLVTLPLRLVSLVFVCWARRRTVVLLPLGFPLLALGFLVGEVWSARLLTRAQGRAAQWASKTVADGGIGWILGSN